MKTPHLFVNWARAGARNCGYARCLLKQSRDLYLYYSQLIAECEKEIEKALNELSKRMQIASTTTQKQKKLEEQHSQMLCNDLETPSSKTRNKKSNFQSPISPIMEEIYGVDITTLSGIDQATALKIMAELGGTVEAWRTAKHFGSWLGLCPGNKISGGNIISSKTKRCVNKAANLLRMAANTLWNSKSYLGAFLRRMKTRLGAPKAITAVAHKMATILYTMIKEKKSYIELGEEYYEKTYRERRLRGLMRQADDLGFILTPVAAPTI